MKSILKKGWALTLLILPASIGISAMERQSGSDAAAASCHGESASRDNSPYRPAPMPPLTISPRKRVTDEEVKVQLAAMDREAPTAFHTVRTGTPPAIGTDFIVPGVTLSQRIAVDQMTDEQVAVYSNKEGCPNSPRFALALERRLNYLKSKIVDQMTYDEKEEYLRRETNVTDSRWRTINQLYKLEKETREAERKLDRSGLIGQTDAGTANNDDVRSIGSRNSSKDSSSRGQSPIAGEQPAAALANSSGSDSSFSPSRLVSPPVSPRSQTDGSAPSPTVTSVGNNSNATTAAPTSPGLSEGPKQVDPAASSGAGAGKVSSRPSSPSESVDTDGPEKTPLPPSPPLSPRRVDGSGAADGSNSASKASNGSGATPPPPPAKTKGKIAQAIAYAKDHPFKVAGGLLALDLIYAYTQVSLEELQKEADFTGKVRVLANKTLTAKILRKVASLADKKK